MKITSFRWQRLELPLSKPYTIAYETVSHAVNIILELQTDSGLKGYGCACPDPVITGESAQVVEILLETAVAPVLKDADPFHYARLLQDLAPKLKEKHATMAMVDMALMDLVSRKAEEPLYRFLGGYASSIPTSVTIGIMSREETLETATELTGQGFRILKVKGGLDLDADVAKMKLLRERFPDITLRFDGNQGYSTEQALEFVARTEAAGIEIFEQPTPTGEGEALGKIARLAPLPVMADESLKSLTDSFRLAKNDWADMVNIKLMKVGGIMEGHRINAVARASGMEAMVGCLDECALGIAAGLHFALSRPNIHYADLDGHLDLMGDPFTKLFTLENGLLRPSDKPGLGDVEPCLKEFWRS